jgi:hypothetical protein
VLPALDLLGSLAVDLGIVLVVPEIGLVDLGTDLADQGTFPAAG